MLKLFYPLRYFRLQNREKRAVDIVPTIIISAVIWLPFALLSSATFFSPNGFLDKILNLTSALTGFYTAALVAAATFSHQALDKVITLGPVWVKSSDDLGKPKKNFLTRRELICYLFGYLAFSALVLSIGCALAVGVSSAETPSFMAPYSGIIRLAIAALFTTAISHMFVITCLGLYYLMDRLYRHDAEIKTKKPEIKDRAA